jgi:hypothetical protein
MGMTPEQFFEAFVLGNYEDYKQHPGCIRRAFNAAVSASHLGDHHFEYYKIRDSSKVNDFKSIGNYVEHLSKVTGGCFRDIRSIANAYKHLYTSRDPRNAVHSSISSTMAIESICFAAEGSEVAQVQEDWIEDTKEGNFESKVIFTKKNGQQLDFLPMLESVIRYWEKELF